MKHYSLLHRFFLAGFIFVAFYYYIFSLSIHQLFNYISEIQNKEMASSWNSSLRFIQSYHFLSKFLQVNPLIADDRNSIQASSLHSGNSDWAVVAMVNLMAEGESIKNITRKAYPEEENFQWIYLKIVFCNHFYAIVKLSQLMLQHKPQLLHCLPGLDQRTNTKQTLNHKMSDCCKLHHHVFGHTFRTNTNCTIISQPGECNSRKSTSKLRNSVLC